ncbi:hypothetical protein [Frankia sp. KB5]|uniref:hypothetical protein n=1 Tax=Frankia sp. KB5 TaxID=683318 RepID=UPI000A24A674|nr:hypothetical protein [Frankia sp. KB5]ORT53019.1 hypothetical protein KBI5_08635 [Frankia sp. KB5]
MTTKTMALTGLLCFGTALLWSAYYTLVRWCARVGMGREAALHVAVGGASSVVLVSLLMRALW